MVNNINRINKNIQFTLETQLDNTINFLDPTNKNQMIQTTHTHQKYLISTQFSL